MTEKSSVAVVGAGLMGHAIAQVFAVGGYTVHVTDANSDALAALRARVAANLRVMGIEDAPVVARIIPEPSLASAVSGAEMITEAASEKLDLKRRLFQEIASYAPTDAILASNTSVIPITEIGRNLPSEARNRLVGTHWWNPAHLVPLVEVVPTADTNPHYVDRAFDILAAIGKLPVRLKRDVPGFVGNRLQNALWREALHMIDAGICDAETIDTVVKASFGMRLPVLGPMENMDLIGLELTRDIHNVLFPHLDCATTASPVLDRLIEEKKLGMRSGEGLRVWSEEEAQSVKEGLARLLIEKQRNQVSE
jgi:3-hydroxybutyryl-CoA dehydrogenase